jgi:hypothetical protein
MRGMRDFLRFLAVVCVLFGLAPSALGATIDVMIVYDTTAKSWVAGHGGTNTFAADAVARMNDATANSNIDLTFRLVHVGEVSYTYSGDLVTDLDNLQAGTGNLALVHQWRDTYGADLVALLVNTGPSGEVAGIAQILTSYSGQPDRAFSVSDIESVNISHTLTHEVGHNLGCNHSKYQLDSPGPNTALNTYSAGWYFTGTNAIHYHTIMAYGSDGKGNTYTEAPLFSTPLMSYQGTVVGDAANGDNSRNIRETMDAVAAYRQAQDIAPDPFTFNDQMNAALSMEFISNTITVSGINAPSPVSITGGTYSINGGVYTSTKGTVSNGDTITVKLTSSANYSTTTNATLTIGEVGGVSDTFSVTTQSDPIGGAWTQKGGFLGTARAWAVGFSVGSKGYIITGWDGSDKNDFWEYDPDGGAWTQRMDFPGTPRDAAVGFSIGRKGYIGTGGDNSSLTLYGDFWEYDPDSNIWTQKAPFGGTARWGAVGFSIGGKGYIGTGDDGTSFRKDFWEYDPDTDAWTEKAPFEGAARAWAVGFSIGGKGYIGTGYNGSVDTKDFWEYDPVVNVWRRKADFGGTAREFPVGFSIGRKGYIGTGYDGSYRNDFWEYDPIIGNWVQRTVFEGTARDSAVGFCIGSKGYIGTGYDGSELKNDFWEYIPYRMKGDLNDDRKVTLADAIMATQVVSGMIQPGAIIIVADVDGDVKIGMAEVIYILQTVAGLR